MLKGALRLQRTNIAHFAESREKLLKNMILSSLFGANKMFNKSGRKSVNFARAKSHFELAHC
jgi:hypothetical protein